jgi:hypothetical protein
MRIFYIMLAAALVFPLQAKASSLVGQEMFFGLANVTSSNGSTTIPPTFFITASFYNSGGPITDSTFSGQLNQGQSASVSIQQFVVTSTLIGFGPGGADDPIFNFSVSPGATLFTFDAFSATLNLTPGSSFISEQGSVFGKPATFNLTQNGSAYDGSFNFSQLGSTSFVVQGGFVSSVPLPPALPLFASALAALGFVAFRQRRSAARQACLDC